MGIALSACGHASQATEAIHSPSPKAILGPPWPEPTSLTAGGGLSGLRLPTGNPPKEELVTDLRKGRGKRLEASDWFAVNYVAFDYKTKKQLEAHWGKNHFAWVYGKHRLVKAWEVGLVGMRVGGRRELIAPSKLAYGNGARIYLIQLLKVSPPQ